jgi:hypothetical protein
MSGQLPLARRLLFPNAGSRPLPRLLVDPDVPEELDAELYDLIAIALRAFVLPWWSKISRYDKQFLPDITAILTAVIRNLDARLHAVHLPTLVYVHLPAIVTTHYRDYRNAAAKLNSSYAAGASLSLPHIFHQLQPHIALDPDGHVDPVYVRQLLDHILAACLPPEEYQPDAERAIILEILLKIVLKDVIPRLTQPWFIHKLILDALDQPPPPIKVFFLFISLLTSI